MKKALEYLEYISECINAILKGAKTVIDSWPANNPFGSGGQQKDGTQK